MRNIFIWIIIIFLINLLFSSLVRAESASLYLSPSSGSFLVGSTFSVSIFVNTEGNEINVVWAELRFPPEILQVTQPTAGTSFITEWITPPSYSNEKGIITFKGGIPGGITTSAGLVSSITFRAVASGRAEVKFGKESKVLLHDGKGTDILTTVIDAKFDILVPPPEGPRVFSPTHPNPNVWYQDSNPVFSWEKEAGVTDFSWSFDQNPGGRPDGIGEGPETMISFSEVGDGIWYFHLRQKKDGVWGKTSHVAIRIDTTPPNDFTPEIKTYTKLIGYQTVVYFETTDDFSGISHYEVSIVDLTAPEPTRSFFTEQISPYKIPVKKPGKYNVIIKAVDKAGNTRTAEVRFRQISPLITHIEGRGLEIKGVLFPWWLIGIFGALLVLGIILVILYVLRKFIIFKRKTQSLEQEKRPESESEPPKDTQVSKNTGVKPL